jgi:hypothetical protein
MRLNLKLKIYAAGVIFAGLTLYCAFNGSRYWSLFWASFGFFLLVELYKIDEIENPQNYRKRKK